MDAATRPTPSRRLWRAIRRRRRRRDPAQLRLRHVCDRNLSKLRCTGLWRTCRADRMGGTCLQAVRQGQRDFRSRNCSGAGREGACRSTRAVAPRCWPHSCTRRKVTDAQARRLSISLRFSVLVKCHRLGLGGRASERHARSKLEPHLGGITWSQEPLLSGAASGGLGQLQLRFRSAVGVGRQACGASSAAHWVARTAFRKTSLVRATS